MDSLCLMELALDAPSIAKMREWSEWWVKEVPRLLQLMVFTFKTAGVTLSSDGKTGTPRVEDDGFVADNPHILVSGAYKQFKVSAVLIVEEPTDKQLASGRETLGVGHWQIEAWKGPQLVDRKVKAVNYVKPSDVDNSVLIDMLLGVLRTLDKEAKK